MCVYKVKKHYTTYNMFKKSYHEIQANMNRRTHHRCHDNSRHLDSYIDNNFDFYARIDHHDIQIYIYIGTIGKDLHKFHCSGTALNDSHQFLQWITDRLKYLILQMF